MSETAYELNLKGLEKLIKALKGKQPSVKIGILGTSARSGKPGGPSNAEIGAYHEFGTSQLPQRSFLRVPLSGNLDKYLERSHAFDKEVLNHVIKEGTIKPWLNKVAAVAETVVADAFDTGGFGQWPPSDMTHKSNHQTLVETGQLRDAISSEVKV